MRSAEEKDFLRETKRAKEKRRERVRGRGKGEGKWGERRVEAPFLSKAEQKYIDIIESYV